MFCNKCGTKNPDKSTYCSKCGEILNISADGQAPVQKPKKSRKGLFAGLIAGGAVVIAAAVVLVLMFTAAAKPVTGDWYNKEYGELFTLREDGIVLLRIAYGQVTGSYKYDPGSGKGVISIDGKDIEFTVEGGALVLHGDGGATTAFDRVEDPAEIAGIIPAPSSEIAPPPVTESVAVITPVAEESAPEVITSPTEAPPSTTPAHTPHPTPAPTPTPVVLPPPVTPPPEPSPSSSTIIILPIIIPTYTDVLGDWHWSTTFSGTTYSLTLTFNADYTYEISGMYYDNGTYSYDLSTLSGVITNHDMATADFTLSTDKQSLVFGDGTTYSR